MTHYKQMELNLMSSQEDSRAKTSQLQENKKESSENDHLFGRSMQGSSKMYGRSGRLLKMYQPFDLKDLHWSYKISARSGIMQNGIAYPVPQLVGYTEEIAYGSSPTRWPTPDAHSDRGASSKERMQMKLEKGMPISINDQVAHQEMIQEHKEAKKELWPTPTQDMVTMRKKKYAQGGKPLTLAVTEKEEEERKTKRKLWATPTTQEVEHPNAELTESGRRKTKDGKDSHSLGLADQVQLFPTPCARDWKGASSVQTIVDKMSKGLRAHMGQLPNRVALEESLNLLSQEDNLSDTPTMPKPNGQLNPTWVEWLMGYPEGWTDCED